MTTYGDDLAKSMWSNLWNLADASAMLYDEKQLAKSSEKVKDKSLYTRKSRTKLKKPATRGTKLLLQWPSSTAFFKNAADSKAKALNTRRSCKRRAVQEKETPKWLFQVMEKLKGEAYEPRLIFERTLTKTDVDPGQSRLSMPFNLLIRNDFLTQVELRIIEKDIKNDNKTGVGAILVDQMCKKYGVMLKRWEMKKETGRGSWNYSLICGWNDVVKANGLEEGDYINVWSFRWRGVLSFALVPALSPDNGTK
ncbi:unnamed protein product [Arabis nemorensis]|uniref:TF-B3 domain-containing protein n=1 Tax=Arabis nemorensis TaxID=586526 RepID=A0A565AM90_9BRAS|nr:unnamed protein product [Arabis nemorensis]